MYKFNEKEHIHTLNGKAMYGTSTIVGVVSKPLTWWSSGMAVGKLGWTNSKLVKKEERAIIAELKLNEIKNMTPDEYVKLLDDAYKAHSTKLKDSAKEGTDLHAELERFVKDHMNGKLNDYDSKILPFIEWTQNNVDKFLWSEAYCYSEKLFCGGISDCGVQLKTGEVGIIDFKSSKEAYFTQHVQIAGYDLEISENGVLDKYGNKVGELEKAVTFYGVFPFGESVPKLHIKKNVVELKEAFTSAVSLYKSQQNYESDYKHY